MRHVPQEPSNLGTYLLRLRTQKGLSMAAAARISGIAHSTISRWESGKFKPCVPEVQGLLSTYGAGEEERQRVLSLIDAPRASKAAQDDSTLLSYFDVPARLAGSLLRTCRLRKGLSQRALAASLQLEPSAICHWERGQSRPEQERLDLISQLLGLEAAEQAFLKKNWTSSVPRCTLDELEAKREIFIELIRQSIGKPHDLSGLLLIYSILQFNKDDLIASEILVKSLSNYASDLFWQGRLREALGCAEQSIQVAQRIYGEGLQRNPGYGLDAFAAYSRSNYLLGKKSPKQIRSFLASVQSLSSSAYFQTGISCEIAVLDRLAGFLELAEMNCLVSYATALKTDNQSLINQVKSLLGQILTDRGKLDLAVKTLAEADLDQIANPRQRVEGHLARSKALAAVGDQRQARSELICAESLSLKHGCYHVFVREIKQMAWLK